MHGLPGSPFGPTGFANCEEDPAGAQGLQADSLSVVYWWLAVIVKKKKKNSNLQKTTLKLIGCNHITVHRSTLRLTFTAI